MVRLEWPLDSGVKGIRATEYVPVRNLCADELAHLQGADDDAMLAAITGLSIEQARKLTPRDRAAIREARRNLT